MERTIVEAIAATVQARLNCKERGNVEWLDKHTVAVEAMVREYLPSGGGFDMGTTLDLAVSNGECLVFHTEFHHMNEHGYYTRWTAHTVRVRPAFTGVSLRVTGVNHNEIKDYIAEAFHMALVAPLPATHGALLATAHS